MYTEFSVHNHIPNQFIALPICRVRLHELGNVEREIPTFEALAEEVIGNHSQAWKPGGKSAAQWRSSLREYVLPVIGSLPVAEVNTDHVLEVLMQPVDIDKRNKQGSKGPFWNCKRETAMRVRQRISMVMRYAVAKRYRKDDPAGPVIGEALPKNGVKRKHHRALPWAEVPAALQTVRDSQAKEATKLAFELLVLTATRSNEVRGARWSEIDFESATWTIPGDRMKTGRDHRVPLSNAALAVLKQAHAVKHRTEHVFTMQFARRAGKTLSDSALSNLTRNLGIDAVPHGFRSSFRDWAAEQTDVPREIVELALAHVEGSKAELAYRRTDYFDRRRELMQQWADHVCRAGAG